jgi:hypothetical protein
MSLPAALITSRKIKALTEPIIILDEKHEYNWLVKGSQGKQYHARVTPSSYSCTCPDFTYRKMECKHIQHCKLVDKRRRECPYGSSCYRTNLQHQAEYSHPLSAKSFILLLIQIRQIPQIIVPSMSVKMFNYIVMFSFIIRISIELM